VAAIDWQREMLRDHGALARAMVRILRAIGFEAIISDSGAHALARVRRGERFALVACDVFMPDLDGPGFLDAARSAWPEIDGALVFVTGAAANALPRDLAAPVFSKPVGVEFYAHVRHVLDSAHSESSGWGAMIVTTVLTPENLRLAASRYGLDLTICAPYISWATSAEAVTRIDSSGAGANFQAFLAYLVDHGWAQRM
jgi:CheY-like chemotaxis protein